MCVFLPNVNFICLGGSNLDRQTMWLVLLLLFPISGEALGTFTRFTNIECQVLDPTYCAYKRCDLKLLGRGIVALNVHATLLKGPFNNAKVTYFLLIYFTRINTKTYSHFLQVNLSLWRKYNGYRPFMINTTMDFCNFMAKKKVKMSFESLFIDVMRQGSNVNHSCPYHVSLASILYLPI